MSSQIADEVFSRLQSASAPCVEDLTGKTCEYRMKRGRNVGKVCQHSLHVDGKGGIIDDLYYCLPCMSREISYRTENDLSLGDVIFLTEEEEQCEEEEMEDALRVTTNQKEQEKEQEKEHEQQEKEEKEETEKKENENADETCPYEYTKDCAIHKKGDICGKPLAKHPLVKEGENFCCDHEPTTGTAVSRCSHTFIRAGGVEKRCHHNLAEDDDNDICKRCTKWIKQQEERQKKKHDKIKRKNARGKCQRILKKGDRKGQLCNEHVSSNGESDEGKNRFCRACLKTAEVKKLLSKEQQEEEQEEQQEEKDEEDLESGGEDDDSEVDAANIPSASLAKINSSIPLPPLDVSKMPALVAGIRDTRQIVERFGLNPQWRYIIELLVMNNDGQPEALAQVLIWYANGRFKCNSFEDTHYWERSAHDTWTKIPISVHTPVSRLKEQLFTHVASMLFKINSPTESINKYADAVRLKMTKNLAKGVTDETFKRFIALLVSAAGVESKQDEGDDKIMLKKFVDTCVKRITSRKDAITTTQFLIEYNKWLTVTKGMPDLYQGKAPMFGKLLSKINPDNIKWGVLRGGDLTKHLVAFK